MAQIVQSIIDMQTPFNMIVLIVMVSCFAGVLNGIASQIRKYLCHREEMELKREMLANGMSAEEIERVTNARSSSKRG